jgi:hypothetical protein
VLIRRPVVRDVPTVPDVDGVLAWLAV